MITGSQFAGSTNCMISTTTAGNTFQLPYHDPSAGHVPMTRGSISTVPAAPATPQLLPTGGLQAIGAKSPQEPESKKRNFEQGASSSRPDKTFAGKVGEVGEDVGEAAEVAV